MYERLDLISQRHHVKREGEDGGSRVREVHLVVLAPRGDCVHVLGRQRRGADEGDPRHVDGQLQALQRAAVIDGAYAGRTADLKIREGE